MSATSPALNLNLRQIEVFRAIMVTGSISGASKLLMVSQPAVSRMLSHTEQRIGLTLFERIKGRLYPSPEARRLFQDVEHVYRDVQRVNTTVQDLVQQRHGVLRIASSPSLGHELLPQVIARFRQDYPEIRVSLECLRHVLLRDRLLDGYADLALSLFPIEHPNLEVTRLQGAPIRLIAPEDHPLCAKSEITMAMLAEESFIGYLPETPFCDLIKMIFEDEKAPYQPAMEASSPQYACAMVKAGAGLALVDEFSLSAASAGVKTLPIRFSYRLSANLLHLRESPLSQAARMFADCLREHMAEGFEFSSHA